MGKRKAFSFKHKNISAPGNELLERGQLKGMVIKNQIGGRLCK